MVLRVTYRRAHNTVEFSRAICAVVCGLGRRVGGMLAVCNALECIMRKSADAIPTQAAPRESPSALAGRRPPNDPPRLHYAARWGEIRLCPASANDAALWLKEKMREAFEEVLGPELGGPKSVDVGYGPSWGEQTELLEEEE